MKKEDLRIVFMGTPEFAVETLKKLISHGYNVVGVVTQPDKPVGRHGSVLQPSAVKQYAVKKGIPVLQPEKMRDPVFISQLKKLKANLQVVVAFRMLPEVVWSMPKYGTFNVHAALLPQYRGAAPINWAIINGEKKTGVTTFFLDKDIDTGKIICRKEYRIYKHFNVETVYNGLMKRGAELCIETLNIIVASKGFPDSIPQDHLLAPGEKLNLAPKIFNETCDIDWNQSAESIYNFVRGLSPIPSAWTTIVDKAGKETVLKIFKTDISDKVSSASPGSIVVEDKSLFIATKQGRLLRIEELQLAGKKRMSAKDFLNGNKNLTESRCIYTSKSV